VEEWSIGGPGGRVGGRSGEGRSGSGGKGEGAGSGGKGEGARVEEERSKGGKLNKLAGDRACRLREELLVQKTE
jgi:hypothetical protein